MEQLQRAYLTFQKKLQHAEVEIIIFKNLPIDTLGLDGLARTIKGKLEFIRNQLTAEIVSRQKHDFEEIERRLDELELEFHGSTLRLVHAHHHENVDHGDNISVCESCLNNDGVGDEEDRSDVSSVYEEMLYEVMGPPSPDVFHESQMLLSDVKPNIGKRPRRRCFGMVASLMIMGALMTLSLSSYFDNNQHKGFLTPT
ncbi:hypothetical protein Tco_0864410 [Tanacetum coccineum]